MAKQIMSKEFIKERKFEVSLKKNVFKRNLKKILMVVSFFQNL